MTPLRYSMLIRWSDEDQAYLVWLPEFGGGPKTHGDSYEQAAQRGQELIESFIDWRAQDGQPLPQADVYTATDAANAPATKVSA